MNIIRALANLYAFNLFALYSLLSSLWTIFSFASMYKTRLEETYSLLHKIILSIVFYVWLSSMRKPVPVFLFSIFVRFFFLGLSQIKNSAAEI